MRNLVLISSIKLMLDWLVRWLCQVFDTSLHFIDLVPGNCICSSSLAEPLLSVTVVIVEWLQHPNLIRNCPVQHQHRKVSSMAIDCYSQLLPLRNSAIAIAVVLDSELG